MTEPEKTIDPFAADPEDFDPRAICGLGLGETLKPWLIGFSAIALGIAVILWVVSILPFGGDVDIYLQGPGVESLAENAQVVIGRQQIGQVQKIELRAGQPTAHLLIKRDVARDLPQDTTFKVASLNEWLPGNIGVVAIPPAQSQSTGMLKHEAVYTAASSPLPKSLPSGFYLLVGLSAVVLIAAAIFARILKTWLLLLSALMGIIAVLSYLNIQPTI